MNILGVDYGEKRIGLAWAPDGIGVVLPFGVVGTREELLDRVREEKVGLVVFGLPYTLENKGETEKTKLIREMGAWIAGEAGCQVDFVDERFSSHGADATGGDVSRDEKAAMIILESYLATHK